MNQIVPIRGGRTPSTAHHGRRAIGVPAAIAGAGDTGVRRFLEFFAATIRNKNTRMAYYRAVTDFFACSRWPYFASRAWQKMRPFSRS